MYVYFSGRNYECFQYMFSISCYNRHHKISVLAVHWVLWWGWGTEEELPGWIQISEHWPGTDMNTALLQGSKEGSGTAGTAAVNVAAGLERCFLRGGNAAAPLHFHYVHLNLGLDFKRLTYMTPQCVPKPGLKWAPTEALEALPCTIFFMFPILMTYPIRQWLSLKRDKGNFLPSFWKLVWETEEERNGS